LVFRKSKMVVLLYVWQFDEVVPQKRRPVLGRHNNSSIMSADELCFINTVSA